MSGKGVEGSAKPTQTDQMKLKINPSANTAQIDWWDIQRAQIDKNTSFSKLRTQNGITLNIERVPWWTYCNYNYMMHHSGSYWCRGVAKFLGVKTQNLWLMEIGSYKSLHCGLKCMFKQFLDSWEVSASPHNSIKNFVVFGCSQL
jgi:hypothetical protein